MPELPEVEVIKRGLARHLPGRRVLGLDWSGKKLRLPLPRRNLHQHIKGFRINAVARRAKFLLIKMDNGACLVVHLGMTGRLGIFAATDPKTKHDHLRLQLDNDMQLRFNDARRFGFVLVIPPGDDPARTVLAHLGPEPLNGNFTPEYLLKQAAGKKRPVKNLLMDNRIVVGIGNIYACEILFHARINPVRKSCRLTKADWQRIVASCNHVLTTAIASGGTTISDFVNESGRTGYFQLELQTYGKEGTPCSSCATPITRKTMAGRSTFFCPQCQK